MSHPSPWRLLAASLDCLLAPGACVACGGEIAGARLICVECEARLPRIAEPCGACGQPLAGAGLVCARCLGNPPRWRQLTAPFAYRGLARDYVLKLKFHEAEYLGRVLCDAGLDAFRAVEIRPEVLLPVPLHRSRLLERGFNQAEFVARRLAGALGIAFDRHALTRRRETEPQSGLSAARRRSNVRGAFAYAPRRVYRHVAVVDDIVTTGSTADEITRLLHRAGVDFVEIWALARTVQR